MTSPSDSHQLDSLLPYFHHKYTLLLQEHSELQTIYSNLKKEKTKMVDRLQQLLDAKQNGGESAARKNKGNKRVVYSSTTNTTSSAGAGAGAGAGARSGVRNTPVGGESEEEG